MKDLLGQELNIGDKWYYNHNNKDGWNLAIVEVVEFKAKTLSVKFVDVNPSKEYESKNYHGLYGELFGGDIQGGMANSCATKSFGLFTIGVPVNPITTFFLAQTPRTNLFTRDFLNTDECQNCKN